MNNAEIDNKHIQWLKSEIERRQTEVAKVATTPLNLWPGSIAATANTSTGHTNQVGVNGDINIRLTTCENGYVIHAYHGVKNVTRVATSETLMDEISACFAILRMS